MSIAKRYIADNILNKLGETMVFVGGPRQVGKTTVAKHIAEQEYSGSYQYLNWDAADDKKSITDRRFDADARLLIFDELHKYRSWRSYLKGIFDTERERYRILVTGSARLNVFRRGGDSLLGRYIYYRLHPFTLAERLGHVSNQKVGEELSLPSEVSSNARSVLSQLEKFGGFPEPFFRQDDIFLRQWQNARAERIVRDDIRDLEQVRDLSALHELALALPAKVGSLFSLNALREDFSVTHKTMAHWVEILEQLYYHYRIYPYASSPLVSRRREPKMYLWDWSVVESSSARFENLIASHLLKFVHYLYDVFGFRAELYFMRDARGNEVDFLVTVNHAPWFAVEVKEQDEKIAKTLNLFKEKYNIPYSYQIVRTPNIYQREKGVVLVSADLFLSGLV